MTHEISLNEAAGQLPVLVSEVQRGIEVVLLHDDQPVAKLVSAEAALRRTKRHFGSAQGQVHMSPDFDEPLDEFAEYM